MHFSISISRSLITKYLKTEYLASKISQWVHKSSNLSSIPGSHFRRESTPECCLFSINLYVIIRTCTIILLEGRVIGGLFSMDGVIAMSESVRVN